MFHNFALQAFGYSLRIVAGMLVLAGLALGQYETAAALGTTTDHTGLPVSGGKVRLENTLTGVSVSTVTDSSGNYQFLNLDSSLRPTATSRIPPLEPFGPPSRHARFS